MPSRWTHLEIEVKVCVADLPGLIHRLRRLGAVPRGRVLERNTLYDTPDSALRRYGRLLRLRIEVPARSTFSPAGPPRTILTSKAPASFHAGRGTERRTMPLYKEKQERETVIRQTPRRTWLEALRSLGFRPGFRYEKYRTGFRLDRLHLDLDETPMGAFLEIEGPPRSINRISRKLGYSRSDYLQGTYWDLYASDCLRRGCLPRNMLFHA